METALAFHNDKFILEKVFQPGIVHTARQGSMKFAHQVYLAGCNVVTRNRLYLALNKRWELIAENQEGRYYKAKVADLPTVLRVWQEDGKQQARVYWQYPDGN